MRLEQFHVGAWAVPLVGAAARIVVSEQWQCLIWITERDEFPVSASDARPPKFRSQRASTTGPAHHTELPGVRAAHGQVGAALEWRTSFNADYVTQIMRTSAAASKVHRAALQLPLDAHRNRLDR